MKIRLLLIFFLCLSSWTFAQDGLTVTGTVRDESGQTLPGANVFIQGTSIGVSTNADGKYKLERVKTDAILEFSFIGMSNQVIAVQGRSIIDVQLENDIKMMDEVVVVGYGSAKAKDLTSPIATINAKEIASMNVSSAMGAVQGKVPGVSIVNSGSPGAGPSVRIRGTGSIGDSAPLYVVDGMFLDNINFLNTNDIENISILKDASAAAIYGVRAANGVVLITTKSGKRNQKLKISYDGYAGVQTVLQRMEMANSAEYAAVLRASGDTDMAAPVDQSIAIYGADGNGNPLVSTDWYDELLKDNAIIQNHSLNLQGGTESSSYSFGVSYFNQEGMMKDTDGGYERISLRAKADFDASKKMKIGLGLVITEDENTIDNNAAWFQSYIASPFYPVTDESLDDSRAYPKKFANPHDLGYATYYTNPIAVSQYQGDRISKTFKALPSLYLEYKPLQNNDLIFKTSINMDYSFNRGRTFTGEYIVGDLKKSESELNKYDNWRYSYIWDNTINYSKSFGDHHMNALIGYSVREQNWRYLSATGYNVPSGEEEYYYVGNGDAETIKASDNGTTFRGMSTFARVAYDFQNKYLLSLTMRADGSSKYQEKWGYFPSIGAGWVLSEERFMKDIKWLDFLKLRGSWGILGNDKVQASDGFSSIAYGGLNESAVFGGTNLVPGMLNSSVFSYLDWEEVAETNIGIDFMALDNRLNIESDYFIRDTRNMVINTTLANGAGFVMKNSGEVRNSGIEFLVNWNDKIGDDFTYQISGNFATLKNEVTDLQDEPYLYTGSAEFRQISKVGEPLFAFYGWETDGVYQNLEDINADPIAVDNGLDPGDLRYVDQNGDDKIDDKDREIIGDYHPDFTYGLNLGASYKGWSLAIAFQGVQGVDILNRKRGDLNKYPNNNIDADLATNLWSPENLTNDYPSAKGLYKTWNTGKMNDFFIEDGSYFRIQNVRLAYDLPQVILTKIRLTKMQVYVNADRPYTNFSSNGFTPEVANGIDRAVYPVSAVFSVGAKISL